MISGPDKNLFAAIEEGDFNRVERALLAGANVSRTRSARANALIERPLDAAARLGHLNIADLLFTYGAPLNCDEEGGTRALVVAQLAGHQDMVDYLRSIGARDGLLIGLCFSDDKERIYEILAGNPARWLNYALDSVRSGNVEMVQDNIANNPYISPVNDGFALVRSAIFQWRLVHRWYTEGFDRTRFQVIHHLLLDWGVDPNSCDESQRTLIHQTAFYGRLWSPTEDERIAHARTLFYRGADPNIRDNMDNSPLDTAVLNNHHRLADMLFSLMRV